MLTYRKDGGMLKVWSARSSGKRGGEKSADGRDGRKRLPVSAQGQKR